MRKFFLKSCAVILLSLSLAQCSWGATDFDGVDDTLNCGSNASIDNLELQGGGGLTYACWAKADTIGEGNAGTLIFKGTGDVGRVGFLFQTTDTLMFFKNGTTNLIQKASNSVVSYGSWIHWAVTWDGSNTAANVHIYKNGSEVSYQTTTNGVSLASDEALNLGIGNRATDTNAFDGSISEVAIWNVVLTAPQIALLASSRIKGMPLQIQPSNLKLYLPMDEVSDGVSGDARTFKDLSGNGNSGTGDNGANNTGFTGTAESILSYP